MRIVTNKGVSNILPWPNIWYYSVPNIQYYLFISEYSALFGSEYYIPTLSL